MIKKIIIVMIIFVLIFSVISGCIIESNEYFTIKAKYNYIQSYPNGGGIFIINMTPNSLFYGNISLDIISNKDLNTYSNINILNFSSRIAEITIKPTENIKINTYKIRLIVKHEKSYRIIPLEVEMFDLMFNEPSKYIIDKKEGFIKWLNSSYPEFGDLLNQSWFIYRTYSKILEVEHWTFLSNDFEMRICCHITIPPHNWSKILLRNRGEIEPFFAAISESTGEKYEIPISEYPILYGY